MLTPTERDCLVRSLGQSGAFFPQPHIDSAKAEIVKRQLQRRGYLTNGPGNFPCITPAGEEAIKLTQGKQLPDH